MKHFILTKVHSSSVATEPKDLEKGLGFIAVLEATKRIGDIVVPDFTMSGKTSSLPNVGPGLVEELIQPSPPARDPQMA